MSGFDNKLPEPIRQEKEDTHTRMMRAAGNKKDPKHQEALDLAHKNKMDRIAFFKKQREKYYTNKGSAINKTLNNHQK